MNILRPLAPHLPKPQLTSTRILTRILVLATLVLFFYIICLKMDLLFYWNELLSRTASFLVVRAFSVLLLKAGFGGGLVFALGLAVRVVLATEDIPERGNWMLPAPAGAPNLELQIGPPGAGVEVGDDLSPIERRVKERLAFYEPGKEIPLDDVEALVRLKRDVVGRMAQLDPHPFWVEQRDRILSESILTPQGPEYKISTLTKKLEELGGDNGSNSHFFRKLKKMREDFLLFGRFD